jgi:hypothetical protein
MQAHGSKIGPQRTSKVSQKLKILPSPADQDEESGRDVYSQGNIGNDAMLWLLEADVEHSDPN